MPRALEIPLPIKIDKPTEFLRVRGVPVYVHWSVLTIAILILLNVVHDPGSSLVGLTCYFGVLFIHETGHLIAAQKAGLPRDLDHAVSDFRFHEI
jgi:hypothetical protein